MRGDEYPEWFYTVCRLISMEHKVLCWSETADEGSSSSSCTKHPPVSPVNCSEVNNLKAVTLRSTTLMFHFWL